SRRQSGDLFTQQPLVQDREEPDERRRTESRCISQSLPALAHPGMFRLIEACIKPVPHGCTACLAPGSHLGRSPRSLRTPLPTVEPAATTLLFGMKAISR